MKIQKKGDNFTIFLQLFYFKYYMTEIKLIDCLINETKTKKMSILMEQPIGNKTSWSIRASREGDEHQLYELRRSIDPEKYKLKELWLKWWHWQYKEFPYGVVTFLAEDNSKKIIGHTASQLMSLKIGHDIVKARFPFGLAVHPDYRKTGLSTSISNAALNFYTNNGNHIIYGVPNSSGYKHAMKRGYVDVACWKRLIRVLDWEIFLRERIRHKLLLKLCAIPLKTLNEVLFRAQKAPYIDGLVIKQVPCFDERINEFLVRVSDISKIMIVKDMDYLNWRYATFTRAKYKIYISEKSGAIHGYLVLANKKNKLATEALIFELIADSETVSRCMISAITEYCRKENIDLISWVGLADKSYLRAFRKQGFFSYSHRKQWKFIIRSSHPSIPIEYLTNPQNWLIQRGDLDI